MNVFEFFELFYFIAFFALILFIGRVISKVGKRNGQRQNNRYQGRMNQNDMYQNNMYQNHMPNNSQYANSQYPMSQGQPNKYKTINSHYSPETLHKNTEIVQNSQQKPVTQSPLAGQFVSKNTAVNVRDDMTNDHNHAYEHKVEPINEASVHEKFEDRKEAYRERKAQMKADLPKTSYSEVEAKLKESNGGKYRNVRRNTAKNGDNGYVPNRSEQAVKCSNCGAVNIVPWDRNIKYSCYFCREEV